jgi:branched-chain amino acid transport system permease protein
MLTMAFAQLLMSVSIKWRTVTGGTDGLSGFKRPTLFGWSLDDRALQFYVVAVGFVLVLWFLRRLIASPLGSIFIGIRENEQRMRAAGYPVQRFKLVSFTIAGALAGVGGGLYAMLNAYVSSDILHWSLGRRDHHGDLGGAGTVIGPAIGAAMFLLIKNVVSSRTITGSCGSASYHRVRDVPAAGRVGLGARGSRREAVASLLHIASLQKAFGSLVVTKNVNLSVAAGELQR